MNSLDFRVSMQKPSVILVGLSLYVSWPLSLTAFNVLYLLYVFSCFLMWQEDFLFWSSLFDVLYDSCALIGISFFRLGKCSMILLKTFSVSFTWVSSPSSIPIIFRLGLFMVSQISWKCCVRIFPDLTFSLTEVSIPSIMSLVPEILSSISCILLMRLPSVVPVQLPKPFISRWNEKFPFGFS